MSPLQQPLLAAARAFQSLFFVILPLTWLEDPQQSKKKKKNSLMFTGTTVWAPNGLGE